MNRLIPLLLLWLAFALPAHALSMGAPQGIAGGPVSHGNKGRVVLASAPDTTNPTVVSVNSNKANGTYGAGEVIDIIVTFSEPVSSTGSVTVTLETGTTDRTCTFTISNSTTGSCNYTVQSGDTSGDLTTNSISGVVTDLAGNPVLSYTPGTNLAANKALVIDTGGGGTGTLAVTLPTMTNSAVTSRTSCVAPCAVFFDMQTTTSSLTTRPFHELLYQWNFGDPVAGAAGTCTDGNPQPRAAGQGSYCTGVLTGNANLDSKNYAEGPEAAHVFESAGTYTVTVTASQGDTSLNGTLDASEFKRGTVQITVSDPEAQWAQSGSSRTLCIANGSTPIAGSGGCPANSWGVGSITDAQAAITTALTTGGSSANNCGGLGCKRILLNRGDTFTIASSTNINTAGPGMIGAYGSGAKPYINTSTLTPLRVGNSTYGAADDWRIVDLTLDSTNLQNAAVTYLGGFSNNFLVLRVDAKDTTLFKSSGGEAGGVAGQTTNYWDGIFIVDSTSKGLYQIVDAGGNSCMYISGNRVAVLGNHCDNDGWSEHGIRTYMQRAVFSHNTIEDVYRVGITMRSDFVGGNGVPPGSYNGTAYLSQNRIFNVGAGIGGGPTNQSTDGRNVDLIFERNFVGTTTNTHELIGLVAPQRVTVRNNVSRQSTSLGTVASITGMDPGIGQCPTNLWIYNNSVYATGGTSTVVSIIQNPPECGGGNTQITAQNNVLYAPSDGNDTILDDPDGRATFTSCSLCNTRNNGEKRTSPPFSTTPPVALGDFTPTSGAYTNARGMSVPVWVDLYGNWQPSTRDIGAVIH